jgi:hypothetical protein
MKIKIKGMGCVEMKKEKKSGIRIAKISRRLWGFNPVTRVKPNQKHYKRKDRNQSNSDSLKSEE